MKTCLAAHLLRGYNSNYDNNNNNNNNNNNTDKSDKRIGSLLSLSSSSSSASSLLSHKCITLLLSVMRCLQLHLH
ncbi:hypothetical protein LOAG_13394 [Loa loa]|uniref:Uncharacterized protein n=1 Tax=Loa loa TaxID=7209 RepID=A0A1S0TJJ1_LOALO|nr:hypothetical protein LOAG_13394 [Loa loa]EFO15117.2 hypothetical protein LOAG_13394 [Loa loa]